MITKARFVVLCALVLTGCSKEMTPEDQHAAIVKCEQEGFVAVEEESVWNHYQVVGIHCHDSWTSVIERSY